MDQPNDALRLAVETATQTDRHDVDVDALTRLGEMDEADACAAIDDVMRQLLY